MIRIIEMYCDNESVYESSNELKKSFDKYDDWILEANKDLIKENLQHEVFYDNCSFILDDETMKLYDANEYYKALYNNSLDNLEEIAQISVKRKDFFELMKNLYD